MNADYFRSRGYIVHEREYGTRVYAEMFTIEDKEGHNFIEVRRSPMSGSSTFTGLSELSCHLRLVNRACYSNTAVRDMAEFMILHNYTFERLYRIDVCYDFLQFDYGDKPETFARRYVEKKFSKVNQCKVTLHANDGWSDFAWESLSWGAPTSMVSTKLYNKTKELRAAGFMKPWIIQAWFESRLIDDPLNLPDVWRIEFSLKSSAKNWIIIEDADAKHLKKKAIEHRLPLFDGRDKLWQRFEELAHHYFQFRYVEYMEKVDSQGQKMLKRKDLCREKRLFKFNLNREFYKVEGLPRQDCIGDKDKSLRNLLQRYRETHANAQIRQAIDILLDNLSRDQIRKITVHGYASEIDAIRLAIATRTGWNYNRVLEVAEEVHQLIQQKEIW